MANIIEINKEEINKICQANIDFKTYDFTDEWLSSVFMDKVYKELNLLTDKWNVLKNIILNYIKADDNIETTNLPDVEPIANLELSLNKNEEKKDNSNTQTNYLSNTNLTATVKTNYKSNLNLRSGPGTNNSIKTSIPNGTKIEVLEPSQNGWTHVKYGDIDGYVSSDYIKVNENAIVNNINNNSNDIITNNTNNTSTNTSVNNIKTTSNVSINTSINNTNTNLTATVKTNYKNNLNLRSGPGTNNSVKTSIPNNTKIEVLESSQNGWTHVKYGDIEGYVSSNYISINNN